MQISVHPKGSSAYWRCPPPCQINILPVLVLNQHPYHRCLCGREGVTRVTHGISTKLGDSELRATPLHFWHLEAQGSWIPQVQGLLTELKFSFLVIHHTSAQGQSLNQSTLNTHSLSKTVFLKKALDERLLCFLLSFYLYSSKFYQTQ